MSIDRRTSWGLVALLGLATVALVLAPGETPPVEAQMEVLDCDAATDAPLLPVDSGLCAELAPVVRDPSALPLDQYEEKLATFFRNFCHRDRDAGWRPDKGVRDTGPFTARLQGGEWVGQYHGTHAPVVIWYSPEMLDWMETNRPAEGEEHSDAPPVPDGAVMVKEMYPAPAAACADVEPITRLLPTSGAAFMVRDTEASHDGWFWGWFGWSGWTPDWPATADNRLQYQGFGQYCLNCHASAANNSTFADLKNVEDYPGTPLVFLSQHFYDAEPAPDHHRLVTMASDDALRLGPPLYRPDQAVVSGVPATNLPRDSWSTVSLLPSMTYDYTWAPAGPASAAAQFLTATNCVGCHDAGGTGLQFDMTVPGPADTPAEGLLLNESPYASWRSSPMGLGGRDPIFYAQLASEIDTFHAGSEETRELVQDVCLGCHGITGQRQFKIDRFEETGECDRFLREYVDATPYPSDPHRNPLLGLAEYGALARDGISCTACHRMLPGVGPEDRSALDAPENACVEERMELLNPQNTGFAKTFTGSFLTGPPDELYGPFENPQTKPMDHALGILPVETQAIRSSEVCGTCHTVHLPVMQNGEIVAYTYEQTTYPEWAMSAYRTGSTPQKALPGGAGATPESCQSCHMASKDDDGRPFRSKIAGIQEYSNFPQAENALSPEEIDLEVREGFARHTLVGLNAFFIEMAQQFPDVLGIRTQDPMLVSKGLDPLLLTEQRMLDQASNDTVTVEVSALHVGSEHLEAEVSIDSLVGHKFPSGVGFRRAFVQFDVVDDAGVALWTSGGTNSAGVLVGPDGSPLPGELWWKDDCSGLRYPDRLVYQPHHQVIERQDQVQIYQELVTAVPDVPDPECGPEVTPQPPFTTSFLSICGHVKDNRLLPKGFLPLPERIAIAEALGAQEDLAVDSGSHAVGDDPDYITGGGDRLIYRVALGELGARRPAGVRATVYYQAIPPYYLQDRFCTSQSADTRRLAFLTSHLNTAGTAVESWKLQVVSTGVVRVGETGGAAADPPTPDESESSV